MTVSVGAGWGGEGRGEGEGAGVVCVISQMLNSFSKWNSNKYAYSNVIMTSDLNERINKRVRNIIISQSIEKIIDA